MAQQLKRLCPPSSGDTRALGGTRRRFPGRGTDRAIHPSKTGAPRAGAEALGQGCRRAGAPLGLPLPFAPFPRRRIPGGSDCFSFSAFSLSVMTRV